MTQTVADHLLGRLREWGVEQVFGYPGDGINGLVAALERADNKPQFVQARHEEMAAFEAVGYAKFSGGSGCAWRPRGPGAIHLLNGLYDAKLDHVPVVAIVGQTARSAMGGSYQQEVDLHSLFKDVASDYLVEVNVAEQLPNALDRAIRTALTRRAPTALIIPSDVQERAVLAARRTRSSRCRPAPRACSHRAGAPTRPRSSGPPRCSTPGAKVAILIGQGARGAARR